MFYIVNVEGVVYRDGQYLMVVRSEQEDHEPGALSFPGGKVEDAGFDNDILEKTARREVLEETGVEVDDRLIYIESTSFGANDRWCVNVSFLCSYKSGVARVIDPAETGDVVWMTAEDVLAHPKARAWTKRTIEKAEELVIGH